MIINTNILVSSKQKINFKLYYFLKELNATHTPSLGDVVRILGEYLAYKPKDIASIRGLLSEIADKIVSNNEKKASLEELIMNIETKIDFEIFYFSVSLLQIKPVLLTQAKLYTDTIDTKEKQEHHPLSVKYDTISKSAPYYLRVNGGLLSAMFFNYLESNRSDFFVEIEEIFFSELIRRYKDLKSMGLETNQMFLLMFSEAISQSIRSTAGGNYEDRIRNILIAEGVNPDTITKAHDLIDKSTEYDIFFELDGKVIGIGAKRTLRERYKQFGKTTLTTPIDLTIEITLGLDVTKQTAINVTQHNSILFVADEIYESRVFLQDMNNVYPASEFSLKLIRYLLKI